jgi:uncharacterized protein YndB with AHSA1/START domain
MPFEVIATARAATRTVSITAAPVAVFAVIADPLRLPDWSPTFARSVVPHGGRWRVTTFTGEVTVQLVVEREPAWTCDYVHPHAPKAAGMRMRAIPSGRGSELIYTMLLPETATDLDVERRLRVMADELETVRGLSILARGRTRRW